MPWPPRSPAAWWAIAGALSWGVACSATPAAHSVKVLSGVGGGTEERSAEKSGAQSAADSDGAQSAADSDGAQSAADRSGAEKPAGDHGGAHKAAGDHGGAHKTAGDGASGERSGSASTANTHAGNASATNTNAGNTNAANTSAGNANVANANAGNTSSGNASAANTNAGNTSSGNANAGNAGGTAGGGRQTDAVEEAVRLALTFDLPEPSLSKRKRRKLWATYYYVPEVEHLKGGFSLRNMDGAALGPRLSRRNWCDAAMQGTVLIRMPDGSSATYNYAGTRKNLEVDCSSIFPRHRAVGRTRFIRARGRWGDGSGGRLLPLRTIAADPRVIPDGSTLYIPAARGTTITLPDGSSATHDGYFYAADHGGAIKQNHIDVFVGVGRNNPFAFVRSSKKHTFEAYLISPRSAAAQRLHHGHRTR